MVNARPVVSLVLASSLCILFSGCNIANNGRGAKIPVDVTGQMNAETAEKNKDYVAALEYWKGAKNTVDGKISTLHGLLIDVSDVHAAKGVKLYEDKKAAAAFDEFIEALRVYPENRLALEYLLNRYQPRETFGYTVQRGDSFESIAKEVYGSVLDTFYIKQFAIVTEESQLIPGLVLDLPKADSFYSQPILDYQKDIGVARKLYKDEEWGKAIAFGQQVLKKHPGDEEASYIVNSSLVRHAEDLEKQGKYNAAISSLSQVDVCFRNMRKQINSLKVKRDQELQRDSTLWNSGMLQKGELLAAEKKYMEALEVFNSIDPEFEGLEKSIANVKKKLSELAEFHYREGVKFFIDDNLSSAIAEWKITLQYNPEHKKAMDYSIKAQQLLQKYEKLKK